MTTLSLVEGFLSLPMALEIRRKLPLRLKMGASSSMDSHGSGVKALVRGGMHSRR